MGREDTYLTKKDATFRTPAESFLFNEETMVIPLDTPLRLDIRRPTIPISLRPDVPPFRCIIALYGRRSTGPVDGLFEDLEIWSDAEQVGVLCCRIPFLARLEE